MFVGSDASINGKLFIQKNVGINVTQPLAPLDVAAGTSTSYNAGNITYFYANSITGTNSGTSKSDNYSIISRGSMMVNGNLVITSAATFSDMRLKTNIQPIYNEYAIDTIRKLKPSQYTFKDTIFHGNNINHGFIAQDVKKVFEPATSTIKKFIPNIYELADISNYLITLHNANTNQFVFDVANNEPVFLKLYDRFNVEHITQLDTIHNSKQFSITTKMPDTDSPVFVYGQEVNDFLTINKDDIFTLAVSALQTIDIELQETKKILKQQEIEIANLSNQLYNQKFERAPQLDACSKLSVESSVENSNELKEQIEDLQRQINYIIKKVSIPPYNG